MTWVLLCRMKTVLTKLKMLILTVHTTVSVMNMALMGMNHGCMGTGFIRLVMVIFGHEIKATFSKGLHQTILHDGSSHSLKVLQERVLKR